VPQLGQIIDVGVGITLLEFSPVVEDE